MIAHQILPDSEGGIVHATSSTPWPLRVRNTLALQIAATGFALDAMPIAAALKTVTFLRCRCEFDRHQEGM